MFDQKKEWSISFAGCGFMGIYYVGATSCFLERFPRFIEDATKISGASAGALMATVLCVGIPLESCCADLIYLAKEARKHSLGPLHPSYNLVQIVKDSLLASLPEDAHVRASGKLCVSLTRVSDWKNVLVSEFDTREELIEAVICSCFVPFYCGVIPPTYRGVHYVDGAASDNLPRCHLRNTITISAYAGESDLCPRGSTLNFHEVRFNNVSIQVNSENMYRVTSSFFPPEPEAMAVICDNGYRDALRFLQENNLIGSECPLRSMAMDVPKAPCCEAVMKPAETGESNPVEPQKGLETPRQDHCWLDPQLIENLPVKIKKVLCEGCKETHSAGGLLSHVTEYLPKKMTSYLQVPTIRPMESAYSLAQRIVKWIPVVPRDMNWLYGMAGDIYKQAWKCEVRDSDRVTPLRRCTSLPLGLNLCDQGKEDAHIRPMTPEAMPTSSFPFTWNVDDELDHVSLTPPPTPTFSPTSHPAEFVEATEESPPNAGSGLGLCQAVGWIRNVASERTLTLKKMDKSLFSSVFK